MKPLLLHISYILILIFIVTAVVVRADDEKIRAIQSDEKYMYEAIPEGKKSVRQKEIILMEIIRTDKGFSLTSKTISKNYLEIIRIFTNKDGKFISGTRKIKRQSGKHTRRARIWRYADKVYVEPHSTGGEKIKEYTIPESMPLAVDISLLVLLRSFPFNTNEHWEVYMIDFSQHYVSVTIRQTGEEHVIVPAGEFECYRIEVIVNLSVFKPSIIFWITKNDPHFLVKHSGMRGPFTLHYVTTLVSIE